MFFSFSKIFWIIAQPLNFLAGLSFIALLLYFMLYKKAAMYLMLFVSIIFVLIGATPIAGLSLQKLENWYPRPHHTQLPDKIDGIIVLGGMLDAQTSASRDYPIYNANANRFIDFLILHKKYPDAKAVITGGQGALFQADTTPNSFLRQTLQNLGYSPDEFIFEDMSKNTYENMVESKNLIKPKQGESWILVTSAFHMPRAVAVFCSNGWPVIPYPAGHHTSKRKSGSLSLGVLDQFYKLHIALREGIGIVAYRLFDKTFITFPPKNKKDSSHVSAISC